MKKILFIISGSIAAPKALEAVKLLVKKKYHITCVVTKSAEEFVTPEEVVGASGNKVYRSLFVSQGADEMDHINLSRNNDLIVVAPASANMMEKMARGAADDLASTIISAANKPIMIAPAMNMKMWGNKATQRNAMQLYHDGIKFIGPAEGNLACGEIGVGRMKEAVEIADEVDAFFKSMTRLKGIKALVTSGPTVEQIDPVRFISNYSSGKQGHAIAQALADMGAEVTLVTGPVELPDPQGVKTIHVKTAEQMLKACQKTLPVKVAVFAAAVSDWRIAKPAVKKMKKQAGKDTLQLTLKQNPDILKTIAKEKKRPELMIGFAAETDNIIANAKKKLKEKKCDWIIANDVSKGVFGQDENQVSLISQSKTEKWQKMSKAEISHRLAGLIARKLRRSE